MIIRWLIFVYFYVFWSNLNSYVFWQCGNNLRLKLTGLKIECSLQVICEAQALPRQPLIIWLKLFGPKNPTKHSVFLWKLRWGYLPSLFLFILGSIIVDKMESSSNGFNERLICYLDRQRTPAWVDETISINLTLQNPLIKICWKAEWKEAPEQTIDGSIELSSTAIPLPLDFDLPLFLESLLTSLSLDSMWSAAKLELVPRLFLLISSPKIRYRLSFILNFSLVIELLIFMMTLDQLSGSDESKVKAWIASLNMLSSINCCISRQQWIKFIVVICHRSSFFHQQIEQLPRCT